MIKIINKTDVSDAMAVSWVWNVIKEGKVSWDNDHYAYITTLTSWTWKVINIECKTTKNWTIVFTLFNE